MRREDRGEFIQRRKSKWDSVHKDVQHHCTKKGSQDQTWEPEKQNLAEVEG
jgi:hypothetical protein